MRRILVLASAAALIAACGLAGANGGGAAGAGGDGSGGKPVRQGSSSSSMHASASTSTTTSTSSAGAGSTGASGGAASVSSSASGTQASCGDGIVQPGEACDDPSPFCQACQFVCPSRYAPNDAGSSCFAVFPVPLAPGSPDWNNTKSWSDAKTACAAVAPSARYVGRLAGPTVLDALGPLATDCPRTYSGGRGGCWIGASCPNMQNCPNGGTGVTLDWVGLPSMSIPPSSWSTGNPSGDGAYVEFIPMEGINDDDGTKLENYICEVTLAP